MIHAFVAMNSQIHSNFLFLFISVNPFQMIMAELFLRYQKAVDWALKLIFYIWNFSENHNNNKKYKNKN